MSDASTVDGTVSNPIFEQVDYDILTLGKTTVSNKHVEANGGNKVITAVRLRN